MKPYFLMLALLFFGFHASAIDEDEAHTVGIFVDVVDVVDEVINEIKDEAITTASVEYANLKSRVKKVHGFELSHTQSILSYNSLFSFTFSTRMQNELGTDGPLLYWVNAIDESGNSFIFDQIAQSIAGLSGQIKHLYQKDYKDPVHFQDFEPSLKAVDDAWVVLILDDLADFVLQPGFIPDHRLQDLDRLIHSIKASQKNLVVFFIDDGDVLSYLSAQAQARMSQRISSSSYSLECVDVLTVH